MTPVEISEREVIEAARKIADDVAMGLYEQFAASHDGQTLLEAVNLLEERERVEQALGTGSQNPDDDNWIGHGRCIRCGHYHKAPSPENCIEPFTDKGLSVPPRPGAAPIVRPPKKLSRRAQEIEARRRSDVSGQHRTDIDYSNTEDPSAR